MSASIYGERAHLYDRVYHWKDYPTESARVREILLSQGVDEGSRVLEAACGTGAHLVHLNEAFSVQGFDLSPDMLAIARDKLPSAELWTADMADFAVDEPADALVCLFSSIGYVFPRVRLEAAAAAFAAAVRPGGALIVEPWITVEVRDPDHVSMQTYDGDDMKICRQTMAVWNGEMTEFDFHYLIVRPRVGVEHFVEHHALWACPRDVMRDVFEAAGFDTRHEPDGLMQDRGLFIGRRR